MRYALSSPRLVRWGAVALVLVGLLGLVGDAAYLAAAYRASKDPNAYYVDGSLVGLFFALDWVLGWFLISLGLVGLHAALSGTLPRRLALAGAACALAAALLFLWEFLQYRLLESYYPPAPAAVHFGLPVAVVLAGVAALWARGLGHWRFLPPFVCLLGTPIATRVLVYLLLYPDDVGPMIPAIEFEKEVLVIAPRALADAGWLLFGLVLFGAREREAAAVARERRALEVENLAVARRLYEGAWGEGDLSVVDELVAPEFFDHRRGRRGPEQLKHAVADLRRAFPDLRFEIRDQTAERDTVTTRWSASGTDRGGVLWYPPTGRRAAFSGAYTDRFAGGKLVEHRGDADQAGLLQQLGLATER